MYFSELYSHFFTFDFLFISAGEPFRYNVPFHGLMYISELFLIIIGVVKLITSFAKNKISQENKLAVFMMGLMLFLAPVPTLVTTHEQLSVIRTFLMIIPLIYLTAQGWLWLFSRKKILNKFSIALFVGSYVYLGAYFWHQFSYFQPHYRPWHRNVADSKLAKYLKKNASKYSQIIVSRWSGQPYVYFVLEDLISIEELQKSYPQRLQKNFFLDKYYFVDLDCPIQEKEGVLFVTRDNCRFAKTNKELVNGKYKIIDRINFADDAPAYQLVVFQKN